MKGSGMKMQINFIPSGHPNRPGTKLESVKAIVMHYTANEHPQATALVNARYFARDYKYKDNVIFETDGVTPFRYGSTQVICDADSVVLALPLHEAAWAVGDKSNNGGYMPVAHAAFKQRQNFNTLSVEICNNDPARNWDAAVATAKEWIVDYCKQARRRVDVQGSVEPQRYNNVEVLPDEILLLRHYDITGKICPKPFVENEAEWENFVREISEAI